MHLNGWQHTSCLTCEYARRRTSYSKGAKICKFSPGRSAICSPQYVMVICLTNDDGDGIGADRVGRRGRGSVEQNAYERGGSEGCLVFQVGS